MRQLPLMAASALITACRSEPVGVIPPAARP